MTPSPRTTAVTRCQRGAATLTITWLLFFAMGLMAAYAARGVLFEQHAAANQYRAAQAFEAAQAGIDWALAQLNQPHRVNAQCLPSPHEIDTSFRERFVRTRPDTAQLEPVTWLSGATPIALQPACVRGSAGWSCHCPSDGPPAIDDESPDDGLPHPAFTVQFSAEAPAGQIRITSIGCTSAEGPCRPGSTGHPDASARVQVVLGLLPGLRVPPHAALTTVGSVDAGTAALGLHNPDTASGGIAVRAGGSLLGSALRLTTASGGATGAAALTHDADLAALRGEQLFAYHFGVDPAGWRTHTAVQSIDCNGNCTTRVATALEGVGPNRMVSVAGDAQLVGPVTLGSAAQPVVLVVQGRLTLRGDVTVHGVVYATDIHWNDSPGGQVHGALISASGYQGNGTPDLHYDADVLHTLQQHTGSFARVPGSWRDF